MPLRLAREPQWAAPAPFPASPKLVTHDYPDNARGLEHLAKDIMGEDRMQIRLGGPVQAAKIVRRVQPQYPEVARNERLQGNRQAPRRH